MIEDRLELQGLGTQKFCEIEIFFFQIIFNFFFERIRFEQVNGPYAGSSCLVFIARSYPAPGS